MALARDVERELVRSGVRFLPWVGDRFGEGFEAGPRLLLLGEAHYDGEKRDRKTPDPEVTRAGVSWYMKPGTRFRFATNAQHLASRRALSVEERADFWHSVALHNYVNEFVDMKPRVRPSAEVWRESRPAFEAVVRALEPQAILVLGYSVWERMLEYPEGPAVIDRKGIGTCPGRLVPAGDREALAFHTMHPSGGISVAEWYERVSDGLRLAKELAGAEA